MISRKKALFVCGNLPFPVVSGGRKREFQLLSELGIKYDTDLLCITRDIVNDRKNIKHLDGLVRKIKLLAATPEAECRLSKFTNTENLLKRFHTDEVIGWLKENMSYFDLVHIERGVIMPESLLGLCSSIVISEQNIESEIVRQVIEGKNIPESEITIYKDYLTKLQKHERRVWYSAYKVLTITTNDSNRICERILNESKVIVLPPKFDHKKEYSIPKAIDEKIIKLMYLGNFNYYPNKYAAIYIINKVIPCLKEKGINFEFRIIGNGASSLRYLFYSSNVSVIDYVENMDEQWEWANLLVAPIFYGSGLKIKVQEALENRTPVITTSSGASGFEHYIDKYIFICGNELEIYNKIRGFLDKTEYYFEITTELASENLRWDVPEMDYLP